MNVIKRYFASRRFAKYDLKIIKALSITQAKSIASDLNGDGWELSREYNSVNEWPNNKGECKLRKGQSSIEFTWQNGEANMVAPARILISIASTYQLDISDKPY